MIPKFKTIEEREKQEKRVKKFFAWFVIAILFFSVIAYSIMNIGFNNQTRYGKLNFEQTSEGWKSKIGDFFIFTQFHPSEVEDIESSLNFDNEDFSNIVYLVAKTENEREAAGEIKKNLLSLKKDFACLPEDSNLEDCLNMTIKSCSDANYLEKIIVFQEKDAETSIIYSNDCMSITGKNSFELSRASDKALFMILGVIK